MGKLLAVLDGRVVRLRSELARDLCNRVNKLLPLVGEVAFATELQLMKRDLSRCHNLLSACVQETNFLSIVTLIESAVAQRKWLEFTSSQLALIQSAFEVGYRQICVSFSDYDSIRQKFSTGNIDTHPRIDFDVLDLDDITDDEEQEE